MKNSLSLLLLYLILCIFGVLSSYYQTESGIPTRKNYAREREMRPNRKPVLDSSDQSYYEEDLAFNAPDNQPQYKPGLDSISLVSSYLQDTSSKTLVAVAAAATTAVLTHFISIMVVSFSSILVLVGIALAAFVYTFREGDLGDLSRSLGVFCILLFSRAKFYQFIANFISQLKGMLMIGERRQFPPFTDNPWKYKPLEDDVDLEFKMTNALLGLILSGAFIGWKIAKQIPFFPGWIGALGGSSMLGYAGTFRDGRGDMLRFLGHSLHSVVKEVSTIAEDVELRATVGVVLARVAALLHGWDEKLHIVEKLQLLMKEIVRIVRVALGRSGGSEDDGEDDSTTSRRPRRYAARAAAESDEGFDDRFAARPSSAAGGAAAYDRSNSDDMPYPYSKNGRNKRVQES